MNCPKPHKTRRETLMPSRVYISFQRSLLVVFLAFVTVHGVTAAVAPRGSISGIVFDHDSGDIVPRASVVILGTSIGAATDSAGGFMIQGVPVGTFDVQVSIIGYRTAVVRNVHVRADMHVSLPIALSQVILDLGEFEVIAPIRLSSASPEMPVSIHKLPKKELLSIGRGLNDPLRALSLMPGVSQTKVDRNDLLVRGGSPSENLIVVDGIELPSISHFATQGSSTGSTSFIDLELIESASLSAGGFGARYGDKTSAVVDLRIRDPRNDRFTFGPNVSATQVGLNTEGPLPGGGSILLSARRSYLDKVFEIYGFGFIPHFTDGLLKACLPIGSSDRISVLAVGAIDGFSLMNESTEHRLQNSRMMFNDQSRLAAAVTWRHIFTSGYMSVSGAYTRSEYEYRQNDPSLAPWFTGSSDDRTYSGQIDALFKIGRTSEFAGGMSIRLLDFKGAINSLAAGPSAVNYEVIPKTSGSIDMTSFKSAAYLQFSHSAGPATITAGLRGDYYETTGKSLYLAPRLSLNLAISPGINLKASAGRYFQSPNPLWFTATSFNRTLTPFGADHLIVGGEIFVGPDVLIGVEGYQKRYFDYPSSLNRRYLIMANTGAGLGGSAEGFASFGIDSLVNKGSGRSRGVEFFIQKMLSGTPWYGILSISHSRTEYTALDGIARPSSHDQPWTVGIALGWYIGESWELGTKFRYYAGTPYTPTGSTYEKGYNSARIGGDHNLDLYVARRWYFSGWKLNTYVSILNVYNRKPTEPPIFEKISGKQHIPGLGIIPTIGVSVEF